MSEFIKIKFVLFKTFLTILLASSSVLYSQKNYEQNNHDEIVCAIQYCLKNKKIRHSIENTSTSKNKQIVILIPNNYVSKRDKLIYKKKRIVYQTKEEIFTTAKPITLLKITDVSKIVQDNEQSVFSLKFDIVNFNANNVDNIGGVAFLGGNIINVSLTKKGRKWNLNSIILK